MMKIELTDEEVATILVALDNYGEAKRVEWLDSRAPPDAPDMGDEELLDEAGSAEWCWQKIYGALATERNATAVEAVKASLKGELPERFNNSVADAVGEGEQPNDGAAASVDPYTLPTWTD
jgi:hypothetical protein